MEKTKPKSKNKIPNLLFCFLILVSLFSFFDLSPVLAYSLDNSPKPSNSFFSRNLFKLAPIDISQFTKGDRWGLTFNDLINTKSFSSRDIGASLKAVLILFIRLIVTTLNVTLGILKALLEVLTRVF